MRLIGDIHGQVNQLAKILAQSDKTYIGIGDIGLGGSQMGLHPKFRKNFRFIRGNHDNPLACQEHPQFLGDYGVFEGVFFVGGAMTPKDFYGRPFCDLWWPDEEASHADLQKAIELFAEVKPSVVISHECPFPVCEALVRQMVEQKPWKAKFGDPRPYSTTVALEQMFLRHKPDFWYFGHYHFPWRKKIDGCVFRCLGELEVADLEDVGTPSAKEKA